MKYIYSNYYLCHKNFHINPNKITFLYGDKLQYHAVTISCFNATFELNAPIFRGLILMFIKKHTQRNDALFCCVRRMRSQLKW